MDTYDTCVAVARKGKIELLDRKGVITGFEVYKENTLSQEENDQKEILLTKTQTPEVEDCSTDSVPADVTDMRGKKKVAVPVLKSMTEVLFENCRKDMYFYLHKCLWKGTLDRMVGSKINNRKLTGAECEFPNVSYWRIDRTNFFADVAVNLKLDTAVGHVEWTGFLVFWCSFGVDALTGKRKLDATIEELTDYVDRKNEYELLSRFLIPYSTNKRVDEVAEEMWYACCKEALTDPSKRNAFIMAKFYGLDIKFLPIYEHSGVKSILFVKEDTLSIGEDRIEYDRHNRRKKHVKAASGKPVKINANTIVVNSNIIKQDYVQSHIFHECFHFERHYLFICLQDFSSNDRRLIPVEEVIVDEDEEIKDAVYFAEKQANRGSDALMLPATHTKLLITKEYDKVSCNHHEGEKYDIAGSSIGGMLGFPDFRIRKRMIQLGHIEAKGALNYVNGEKIAPFAFSKDAWRENDVTYIINEDDYKELCEKNLDFRALIEDRKYVYADGHVVINSPEYVMADRVLGKRVLTGKALRRVDGCCLRFVRKYIQKYPGHYVYGRMYCDTEYVKQNEFYLSDIINEEQIDEIDARIKYEEEFPKKFKEALKKLKSKNKLSDAKLAEIWGMDDSTFSRALDDPRRYRNEDFMTLLCLVFKLPDWISELLFRRAKFQFDDDDKRNRALKHILRTQSGDGIDAANRYLVKLNLEPLSFKL